ncbi:iron ABC transporter substrate-binding protein [Anaerosporomusa subterranea]|uniref:Iron ABC transporter substrate-binding protein n=1 Tax=Anaerosporomusa subterranea TaxID=1794912 RepID=A0A154BRR5_ANASB|nr:ABC transporter substrate-binding protein [Anaerosporomusa subterranea]KYZ76599.1 iron ABC transporter substrate-binding protein [Anaerosporomusa subterranea]
MTKTRRVFITLATLMLFCAGLLAGCGSSQPAAEKTAQSKNLTIYTALNENEIGTYVKAFEAKTGIKVSFVRLSAGEIITRLRAEKNNPKSTIVFGGPSDTFIVMAKDGLLEPYASPAAAAAPEQYKDKQGYWSPIYIGILGFGTNSKLAEQKGIKPPESWDDLLKPEFKGLVSIAHPGASGTSYTVLASLVQMWGEDNAFAYLKKLNLNIRNYEKSGAAPAQKAGLGEALVGICFSHDILIPINEGYPLKLTFPRDGTGYEIGGMAMVKNGPKDEVENGKKFIDFFAGKEGQETYETAKTFRLPVNTEAKAPKGAVKLTDIKTIRYDNVWAGENRGRLVEKFNKEIMARPQ